VSLVRLILIVVLFWTLNGCKLSVSGAGPIVLGDENQVSAGVVDSSVEENQQDTSNIENTVSFEIELHETFEPEYQSDLENVAPQDEFEERLVFEEQDIVEKQNVADEQNFVEELINMEEPGIVEKQDIVEEQSMVDDLIVQTNEVIEPVKTDDKSSNVSDAESIKIPDDLNVIDDKVKEANLIVELAKDENGVAEVEPLNEPVKETLYAKVDEFIVNQAHKSVFNLLENDLGLSETTQISIVSQAANGVVKVLENGMVSYEPLEAYVGGDEFIYKITGGDGVTSVASVSVEVECKNNCTSEFLLSWKASQSLNVIGYIVYMGQVEDALDTVFELENELQFSYVAKQKGDYYFAVSAVNERGEESELSETIFGTF